MRSVDRTDVEGLRLAAANTTSERVVRVWFARKRMLTRDA